MTPAEIVASCLLLASQTYEVPPEILIGILRTEGGKIGQEVKNTNGSYDLGPMQINTIWLPQLAKGWKTDIETARKWVRDDACTNLSVSAWILKSHYRETKNYETAVSYYHSRTPKYGEAYRGRVVNAMERYGFPLADIIDRETARTAPPDPYYTVSTSGKKAK